MSKDKTKLDFDEVYGYIPSRNYSIPSFKVLYHSEMFSKQNNYKKLELCLIDFLAGLRELRWVGGLNYEKEGAKGLKSVIESNFYPDIQSFTNKITDILEPGYIKPSEEKAKNILERFKEKNCVMIESQNNPTLGKEKEYDANIEERHLFYKIKASPKFVLNLEEYKPARLDEINIDRRGRICFFKDEDLNKIVEQFNFSPDYISVFTLKQIEQGGDDMFQRMFEWFREKIKNDRIEDSLKALKLLKKKK